MSTETAGVRSTRPSGESKRSAMSGISAADKSPLPLKTRLSHRPILGPLLMKVIRPFAMLAANMVCVLIALPILYAIEPFWRVRITHFSSDRIGHLAQEPQMWLAKVLLGFDQIPRCTHILIAGNPCNRPLLKMWQRRLPIISNRAVSAFWHYCKHILRRTRFDDPKIQRNDEYLEFDFKDARLSFTNEEEKRGRELLERMGIGKSDWFMAFNVRDHAFACRRFPDRRPEEVDVEAQFRNQPVEHYLGAARVVTERGGFAVRLGGAVSYPLKTDDPRIIDYAWNFRSEFGDVFLCGKCRFFLGGPAGLNFLPTAFGVPVAAASMIPLFPMAYGRKSLQLPLLLRRRTTGELVTFREAHELGMFVEVQERVWNFEKQFSDLDIALELLPPEDNTDLCRDMIDRLEGTPPLGDSAELQRMFKERFLSHIRNYEYAPDIGPRFALKYRHLIEA